MVARIDRREFVLVWSAFFTIVSSAQAAAPKQRVPVPARAKLQKATRTVRKLYRPELQQARSLADREKLARRLLTDAGDTTSDDAGRYALLQLAREQAILSGDAQLLSRVLGVTASFYKVNRFTAVNANYGRCLRLIRQSARRVSFARTVLRLAREASLDNEHEAAKKLTGLGKQAARRAQQLALVRAATGLRREIDAADKEYSLVKPALRSLNTDDLDPAANAIVGKYLCVTQEKWADGISYLTRAGPGKYRDAARAEQGLAATAKPAQVVAVADQWWKIAQAEKLRSASLKRHAAEIYRRALDRLTGLERTRVRKRIEAAPQLKSLPEIAGGGSPKLVKFSLGGNVVLAMRRIEPGTFVMGSPVNESFRGASEVQHQVKISRPYYIGVSEVTQAQWVRIAGARHASKYQGATMPVNGVSWEDARQFLTRLNKTRWANDYKFRLPTEAEWEYACRAGQRAAFSWGEQTQVPRYAWYQANSQARPRPVASLRSNAWGLFDMNGNVWEWCSDWAGPYRSGLQVDPSGPTTGAAHRIRGGSFVSTINKLRSAYRAQLGAGVRNATVGLRLVCERRR